MLSWRTIPVVMTELVFISDVNEYREGIDARRNSDYK